MEINTLKGLSCDVPALWLEHRDALRNFILKRVKDQEPVLFYCGTQNWLVGPEHYKTVNFPNQPLSPEGIFFCRGQPLML